MDTCICMVESVHCSSETITILSVGYTPIQNKKVKLKKYTGISQDGVISSPSLS